MRAFSTGIATRIITTEKRRGDDVYKIASKNKQSALDRGRMANWAHGQEFQSIEEQIDSAKRALWQVEERILSANTDKAARASLGLRKLELQNELRRLKKLVKSENILDRSFPETFKDVAKEMLSKTQYHLILEAAKRQYALEQERGKSLAAKASASQ